MSFSFARVTEVRHIFYIEIDDDDGNDMLNYSGSTESYSVPSDNDSEDMVDYRDQDDQEGNHIMKHYLNLFISFSHKVQTHGIFQCRCLFKTLLRSIYKEIFGLSKQVFADLTGYL